MSTYTTPKIHALRTAWARWLAHLTVCFSLTLIGVMPRTALANGSDQLSSAGQIWYNPSTAEVENITTPFGGNTSLPIEYVWLYRIGSGYLQGFSPSQTGQTLNIWAVGYQANMIVVRCARRQGCTGGMLESNHVTITPPTCPTISISPTTLPVAPVSQYYGPVAITASGGLAPYWWDMTAGSLPPGLGWSDTNGTLEIFGYAPATAGTYSFTFEVHDATNYCKASQTFTLRVVSSNISLGDRVWNDLNKDGIQDAGEAGLAGITVRLLNGSTGSQVDTTTTDASGYYTFSYVDPGSYRIGVVVPAGRLASPANASGTTDALDSDLTAVLNGMSVTDIINVTASDNSIDAGLYMGSDYGDLPAPYSTTGATAAFHAYSTTLRLGANLDVEVTGQPNATATGDDTTGTTDDEDGVSSFPALTPGATATLTVKVKNSTGANRFLYVFFDWNADEDFLDAGEALAPVTVTTSALLQTVNVSVPVPAGTTAGSKGVRLRVSATAGLTATGDGGAGEVEDYFATVACSGVTVSGPGSLPSGLVNSPYPSQTFTANGGTAPYTFTMSPAIPGLSITTAGVLSGTPTTAGTFNSTITATDPVNCSGTLPITIVISSCPAATTLAPGESYTLSVSAGVVSAFWLVDTGSGPVPITGANSLTYIVTAPGSYTWIGLDATSCVVESCCPMVFNGNFDHGDLPDTGPGTGLGNYQTRLSDNGPTLARDTRLSMGGSVDVEGDGLPSSSATGDDVAGTTPDDEDGITAMPAFYLGGAFTIPVTVFNNTGENTRITAQIDWNNDGDFLDSGEALTAVNVPSAATSQVVNVTGTVPATAYVGSVGARFLLAGTASPALIGSGEIEDYIVTVIPAMSIGNMVFHDVNCNGVYDAGDVGILGIPVELYSRGPDAIAYNADDVLVKSTVSSLNGDYRFDDLVAGSYWVKVTPPVATFPFATLNNVTLDNGVDNDSNGAQPGGGGTAIRSPVITLSPGAEAVSEDGNASTDLTIDFGLRPGFRVGDLVWRDNNDNGIHDPSEPGLPGVTVNLMSPGADGVIGGGDDTVLMTTTTNISGNYLFTLSAEGNFFVRISPLVGLEAPSQTAVTADNGVDDDNNGTQPGGPTTYVYSNIFNLARCKEPGSTGTANDELTIDLGLVPSTLGIGNLVFRDDNGNNHADPGEGINGVTVQLYRSSQTPGVSTPIAITTTAGGGFYQFINLARGQYIVHIPAVMFATAGPMKGMLSVEGVQTGSDDDNLGEDGLDSTTPETTGISSRIVSLTNNAAPVDNSTETGMNFTDDNTLPGGDNDNDFTVDLGFYRWVGVGNFVFFDANGDGKASASEGVNGVRVELYSSTQTPGVDTPLEWTTTANGGKYLFNKRPPGIYRLHVPKEMFASNGPLAGKLSIAQGLFGDDDVGEDGLNDTSPQDEGVSTAELFLVAGVAPTAQNGETGVDNTSDDATDASINLTVDFGFQDPTAVGNLVYHDANANGHFDSGEGIDDVLVEIYRSNSVVGSTPPLAQMTTSNGGHYKFSSLAGGDYFIHLPISNFETNGPLQGLISMLGSASANTDDNVGEDGLDSGSPVNTGISTAVFTLLAGSMPVNSGTETGYLATEDDANIQDANGNMTIDLGLVAPDPNRVGLGNSVYNDLNGDGTFDDGEGVDGVIVQLYNTANTLVATTTTGSGGCYLFSNLTPGTYYVKLPALNWASSGPLKGLLPIPGQGGDNGHDDDLDENGDDPASPSVSGVRSTNITLAANSEPANYDTEIGKNTLLDEGLDENYDLTVDFGLYDRCGVGNLVFVDANGNGKADTNEGVSGVTVKIFAAGADPRFDTPIATQVTETTRKGFFMFLDLNPGAYFLHIPAAMFQTGGPLLGKASMTGVETTSVDDNFGENGVDPGDIADDGISTDVFILRPGTMPAGTTEAGLFGTADNTNPNGISGYNIDLTRDFGFVSNACIGNLVFKDLDRDGKFTNGVDVGVDGVTVQLWSGTTLKDTKVTANGGQYEFCTVPGSYSIKIPSSMFQTGAPLANVQATTLGSFMAAGSTTNWQDDNAGQDASDNGSPLTNGASTGTFATAVSTMPGPQTGETGFASSSDDLTETDVNLTIDLGFKPLPLTAGNLVFNDANSNGIKDANEAGVAGVTVKIFADTVDPQTGTATATTVTGTDGSFMLQAFAEGQYFIHVPKAMFATGAPLAGKNSSPGAGTGAADDNVDENGLDSATPTTSGVSTGLFSLVYGTGPVDSGTEKGVFAAADNAADANGNLTLDLGFRVPPPGTPLAGRVRRDLNGDGTATTADAPLAGVEIALYVDENRNAILDPAEANAVAATQSSADGTYLFEGLAPDAYLVQASPLPGSQAVADSDGGAPDQTSVVLGTKPVTYIDFLQCPCPDTFAQWQAQHDLGTEAGASDDPDGDGLDNLAEYALGSDPKLGVRSSSAFRLEATAGIDALLRRPVQGHQDLRYVIEGSRDASTWTKLSVVSTSTVDGNDEVLRYTPVAQDAVFQAQGRGFVRLRIERDADLDGTAEDVSLSAVQGFALRDFGTTETTFSMPLLREALYSGRITETGDHMLSIAASAGLKTALGAGRECFVEIVSGAHRGQCFDLDEAATTDSVLAIDLASARNTSSSLPAGLVDARVTVRAHWTLGDLLPAARFHATTSASTADRVMFFENGGYVVNWLLATPQGSRWVRTADATFADMGRARIVTALDGCFVQSRGGAVTLPFVGEVRTAPMVRKVVSNMQLLGTGAALAQTFDSLTTARSGDKLRLWNADQVTGSSGFDGFTRTADGWVRDVDQISVDVSVQLAPFRAFFLAPPAPSVGAAP